MNLFETLMKDHRIPTMTSGSHHCRPGWIQIDCPYCGRDSGKFHCGFSLVRGSVNCWRCGRLDLYKVLSDLTRETPGKVMEWVRILRGGFERTPSKVDLRGTLVKPKGVGPLLEPHLAYLRGRKYDPSELQRLWEIGGIGIDARLSWRIFIPIFHQGREVSWTTRNLTSLEPRYKNAKPTEEAMSPNDILYGEDYCRHGIIAHEGPFDVWRTGPGAVATAGIQVFEAHVIRISKYPMRVICFDNEKEAQRRARKLCNRLAGYPGTTKNVVLDAKDAGESGDEEIRELRELIEARN